MPPSIELAAITASSKPTASTSVAGVDLVKSPRGAAPPPSIEIVSPRGKDKKEKKEEKEPASLQPKSPRRASASKEDRITAVSPQRTSASHEKASRVSMSADKDKAVAVPQPAATQTSASEDKKAAAAKLGRSLSARLRDALVHKDSSKEKEKEKEMPRKTTGASTTDVRKYIYTCLKKSH